tara:strand:+ start:198 stop:446 length:249 start_codon:yes stop_codon:yes gene_type:complete
MTILFNYFLGLANYLLSTIFTLYQNLLIIKGCLPKNKHSLQTLNLTAIAPWEIFLKTENKVRWLWLGMGKQGLLHTHQLKVL